MTRMVVLQATLAVLCAMWLCPPAQGAVIDSEEKAKEVAASFAQAMNWPYDPPSSARLRDDPGHGVQWQVDFPGERIDLPPELPSIAARVYVHPETGQIRTVVDWSRGALVDIAPEPVEDGISEQEARAIAERVLDLDVVGRPPDARFRGSEKVRDNKEWRFTWARVFHDIPYRYDVRGVSISAIDGSLLGFGCGFVSAPPPSAVVELTEAEAVAAARVIAVALGIPETETKDAVAELRVVQPDNYWGPGPVIEHWGAGAPSRVAWVVTIKHRGMKEFWIDAEDGSLLGGTQTLGPGFTGARLGEDAPEAEAEPQASSRGSMSWPIAAVGVALPLALLLLFLVRRAAKGGSADRE